MKKEKREYFSEVLVSLGFVILILLSSCKKDNPVIPPIEPPPVVKDTVAISVEGTTHRSIEVIVQCTMNNYRSSVLLFRTLNAKDTLVAEFPITVRDTTIIDDDNGNGLQLNTEYSYYAVTEDTAGQRRDTSNQITARTLAATSHNYTWQEYNIGNWQSVLYDVWGTDENNVWAVGIIYIDNKFYGGLHYNGTDWIPDSTVGGYAIYGFSQSDIWVAGGGIFKRYGNTWQDMTVTYPVFNDNGPYTSLWGTSSNDMYFGSTRGKIIHWDGHNAQIAASGYQNPLHDLDGYTENFIISVGTDLTRPSSTAFYDGSSWNNYSFVDNSYSLNSVSIVIPNEIYWGGEGIFRTLNGVFSRVFNSGYYVWDIDYNRSNGEIVSCGSFDGVYIYNGLDWTSYQGIASNDHSSYSGIFLTGNTIFCVGSNNSQATIIIGTKN